MVDGDSDSSVPRTKCFAGGAKRSEREPVRIRAMVEVSAIVVTWVDGRPAGGCAVGGYDAGVRVWMTVPSCGCQFDLELEGRRLTLLMYASPGPVTRKKPNASHHIVWSLRKILVS